ncbi:MAG: ABC transporter permease [Acidobacteriia bacterium]|nr:ABC transporter permease [Terriglobia bacterium]
MAERKHRDRERQGFGGLPWYDKGKRNGLDWIWLDHLSQDLRYAFRVLRRSPALTAAAIAALALGVGANTAIFSVVYTVLYRPLPYPEPGRLTMIWETRSDLDPASFADPKSAVKLLNHWMPSNRTFAMWRERNQCFEHIAGFSSWTATFSGSGEPERIAGTAVTPDFFSLLGAHALTGRTFSAGEDGAGHDNVIVLGQGLWQRRYGADPDVLGRKVLVDGTPHTVIGIMPASFETVLPMMNRRPDFYLPSWHLTILNPGFTVSPVLGQLKPGVSLAQAQAEMSALSAALERELPRLFKGHGVRLETLASETSANARPAMLVLLGTVACVLLLCCANVANLLLARATARQREIAVRAVLGAGRWRVARQMLTESIVLGITGGLAGILLARWGVQFLVAVIPEGTVPRIEEIRVDAAMLVFAIALSLITGLLFGLVPAFEAAHWLARGGLTGALTEGSGRQTATRRSHRLRSALVVAEIAITVVLLTGAGLLIRSFVRLRSVDLGFRPENVIAGVMTVNGNRDLAPQRQAEFIDRVLQRVRALPSVRAAAFASQAPLASDLTFSVGGIQIEGHPRVDGGTALVLITPDYFRAIGTRLVQGREFTAADTAAGAAVVNRAFVKRYLPDVRDDGSELIGRRLSWDHLNLPIVGIVADVRSGGPESEGEPEVFVTHTSMPSKALVLVVRTAKDPMQIATMLRAAVREANPEQPLSRIITLEKAIAESVAQPRFHMLVLAAFAGLALVLAAVGIGGVVAYSVARRTHEIGVRIALGASRGSVYRLILGQALGLALTGVAIGLLAAGAATRVLTNFLFEIRALDPETFAAVAVVLVAIAVAASWLPARRATRIDPQSALRCD